MNFLAHLVLAGDDESLRLGAMLGDFVRGRYSLEAYPGGVQRGILMHRHIDGFVDALPETVNLRRCFRAPFRRYSGIIIDLAFDHELAVHWPAYSDIPLEQFDREVRELLARHDDLVPDRLRRFMGYADRRGLFANYRFEDEVMHSLRGIGRRLSRPNPLHRVAEVWDDISPRISARFEFVFRQVQSDAEDWLKSKSTMTGS
jgi:acyl carrier protein phosphodiesterase